VKYEATLRFINGNVRTMLDAMKGTIPRAGPDRLSALMSMFNIFNVSGSAVSAQSQRLNVVASATWPMPTPWPAPTARPTRRARWCSRPS
jgi:hypothetical protein